MKLIFLRIACIIVLAFPGFLQAGNTSDFLSGLDLSSVPEIEKKTPYKINDHVEDVFGILQAQGINAARFRLWNDPKDGLCGIDEVAADALRAKAHGMSIMVDFHYSDWWADPQHQPKPKAWAELDFPSLCKAVHDFTRDSVTRLVAQGTPPDLVQVGNEIRNGMLWPEGRVDITGNKNPAELAASLERLSQLIQAGITGVREATPPGKHIGVVIHVDGGGYPKIYLPVFDTLTRDHVDYDAIGLSYYPGQAGTMDELQSALATLISLYYKKVYICETNYPYTGNKAPFPTFPPTPEGQEAYLKALVAILHAAPEGKGGGIYYWGGERIHQGSSVETLFDNEDNALIHSLRALVPASQ